MRLGEDRRGVAGFFEDLPTFLVILVSLFMFLASIGYAFASYNEGIMNNGLYDEAFQLSRSILSYDKLLTNGTYTAEPVEGRYLYTSL